MGLNGRKSLLQKLVAGDTAYETYRWSIKCSDGSHRIAIKLGKTSRSLKNLYVDGDFLTSIPYTGKGIIPKQEYEFECGGDTLILVLHANKVDLVHKGVLQTAKIKYEPHKVIPIWIRVILLAITVSSALIIPVLSQFSIELMQTSFLYVFLGLSMSLACTLMLLSSATNPFFATKKKIIYCFLSTVWSFTIQFIIFFGIIK